jgi:gluconolactonase
MDGFEILAPRFAAKILPNAPLEKLADGFRWTEGPVWFADAEMLVFSDIPNDRTMRWCEGGVSVFRAPSGFANGHARDGQGRLIECSHRARCVRRYEPDGRVTVLAESFQGKRLNSPNDVLVKSDGSIWFSDPHYGINTDYEGGKQAAELPAHVYRIGPDGSLELVADDFEGPNGLCFSPDESRLYVVESGRQFDEAPKRYIRVFEVGADGKSLHGGRVFHKVAPGMADGIRCDVEGDVWSSAGDGVHCIDPRGDLIGKILVPGTVSNIAFGGRNSSRMFVCAGRALYAIYTNTRGLDLR